ncbi:hypothetical protein [Streptomyces sp. NPDC002671]
MLDEEQDEQAPQEDRVHMEDVDGEDPLGLRGEELRPGAAGPLGHRIDPGPLQDLPDGGSADTPIRRTRGPGAAPLPAQHGTWGDQQPQRRTAKPTQQLEQGCEHRAVPAAEGGLWAAALQDGQLLPEHQYPDILGRRGPRQQAQPAQQQAAESADQTERHDSRTCADALTSPFDPITS